MLFLSEEEVKDLLNIKDYIQWVEEAYQADGLGEAFMFPRQNLKLPEGHSYKILSGALPFAGVIGTLCYSGGYPRHTSPFECRKMLTLFSAESGEPIACIEAEYLSWFRTGATAGVAARHLALPEIECVAILGSGRIARSTLMALCSVREVKEARVFSPTKEYRLEYAREMGRTLNIPVTPSETPQEAVKGAQVVATTTTNRQPVFFGSWWKPGALIIGLGSHDPDRRELDGLTMSTADLIVVDHREQALGEEGEIIMARQEGLLSHADEPITLGEVVAGKHKGRRSPDDKIVLLSGGIALEYITVGWHLYKKKRGIP